MKKNPQKTKPKKEQRKKNNLEMEVNEWHMEWRLVIHHSFIHSEDTIRWRKWNEFKYISKWKKRQPETQDEGGRRNAIIINVRRCRSFIDTQARYCCSFIPIISC